jgi:N-acetyl sugar amidotransferase
MTPKYQICQRCVMDTTDPNIRFDSHGICNHCTQFFEKKKENPHNLSGDQKRAVLGKIINNIKREGKNKKYDCIVGVSGGVDSTYVAYLVKKLGLRPLAVHFDNCWDSELAVHNIEKTLKILDVDLYTYVVNWEEFKDLQLAFLKASTPDSEIPTDHAIHAVLHQTAIKHHLKYIIIGMNFNTESIVPSAWSHGHYDWKYIKTLHQRFGQRPFKTYPKMSYWNLFYWRFIKHLKYLNIFDYFDYNREQIITTLTKELNWQNYEGKHYESLYTKFYQGYILPTKFGFDKRRAHLSNLICSNQISRDQALEDLKKELYPTNQLMEDKKYVEKKFGLTKEEFESIMQLPPKSFWDYPSHENSAYYSLARKFYMLFYKSPQ